MSKITAVMFMVVSYVFLTGCTSTIAGVREDVSKPFKWVGSVGDKIAPCKTEECKKDE
jgi:predicted small secreted protein